MFDQGEQEERNHVIRETSINEQDDNKRRHMLQTIQSPILAFKPPNPQDIRNKKTNEQIIKKPGEQKPRNKMIREIRRKTRRKKQG